MKNLIFTSERWEDQDFVITARPACVSKLHSEPIGNTFDRKETELIADFLNRNYQLLYKLFIQVEADEKVS